MNVDSPDDMLSEAPTRVKILSTMPIFADVAGTKLPMRLSDHPELLAAVPEEFKEDYRDKDISDQF